MTTPDGVSRRKFLQTAGRAALVAGLASQAGWLNACTKGARSPRESVASADWEALARRLSGTLIRPGDPGYSTKRLPFNRRYADIHAAGLAYVAEAGDVGACITWARDAGVPIVARSGGHSYGGYSNTPGLIVDVSNLKAVEPDGGRNTVRVGAGAKNTDVYNGLQPLGVAFSAGRCPSVGISGLTLGGGFGFSSRKLGLTSDALIETDIVTADGHVLTCSETENPDLFWALRGGGGGNFGINTSFTYQAWPVDRVAIYSIEWPWEQAAEGIAAMQKVILSAPDAFSGRVGAGATGLDAASRTTSVSALGQFFGSKSELAGLLDPVLTSTKPSKHFIAERTFWQAKNFFFQTTPIDEFQEKSAYVKAPFSEKAIETIVRWVGKWPGSHNEDGAGMALFGWGGKINGTAPGATAFVHRDAAMLMAFSATWTEEDSESVVKADLAWLEGFYEEMQPYLSTEAYQNFIDPTLKNWQQAYYGDNFERLVGIKREFDPDEVFSFAQGIPA